MRNNLPSEIQAFLTAHEASHYFLAVSGGMDSMLLLDLVRSVRSNLTVLHVNYQLRGAESEADQAFVEACCQSMDIPCMVHRVRLSDKLSNGGNLQQMARDERYAFFTQHLKQSPGSRLLVAHHQDDQFETFWLQLFRGAGMSGLKGMLKENGKILRPLLRYSKQELKEFATSHNIKWREDRSNQKTDYQRNALRLKILPELEREIPALRHSILFIQDTFQTQLKEFEPTLNAYYQEILQSNTITLDKVNYLFDYQIIELLKKLHIPTHIFQGFRTLFSAEIGKKMQWNTPQSPYCEVVRERDELRFIRKSETRASIPVFHCTKVESLPSHFSKEVLFLDAQKLTGTLHVRLWESGDRMFPIGLSGSKLISDILKDVHVESSAKKQQYVLCDEEKIIACIGYRVDRRAIADQHSTEILRVDFNNNW